MLPPLVACPSPLFQYPITITHLWLCSAPPCEPPTNSKRGRRCRVLLRHHYWRRWVPLRGRCPLEQAREYSRSHPEILRCRHNDNGGHKSGRQRRIIVCAPAPLVGSRRQFAPVVVRLSSSSSCFRGRQQRHCHPDLPHSCCCSCLSRRQRRPRFKRGTIPSRNSLDSADGTRSEV